MTSGRATLSGVRPRQPTGARGDAENDGRTTNLLVVAILAFRVLFTATPFPVLLQQGGATQPAVTLGMTSIVLSAVMVGYVARGMDLAAGRFVPLLVVDFLLSCAVGLSATGAVAGADSSLHAVLWFPFHGTVMLWTVLLGPAWGCASVAAGVGMFVARYAVDRPAAADPTPLALTHAVWLTLPLLVAVVASVLLRAIVQAVLAHGVRVGRSHEQVRMTRTLHDTVLQTLESMALRPHHDRAPQDETAANERLTELRATAARQAVELRQLLDSGAPADTSSLSGMLGELAGDFTGMGLRVELVVTDLSDHEPAPRVRRALRDAAQEALYNVVKHAGVNKAVVRAAATADGVEVVVRDRGRGFDPKLHHPGFGIEQSIVARMREVGGDALVWSAPRRGTRVTLVATA